MGLDMYLKAAKYVSGYDISEDKGKQYLALLKTMGIDKEDLDQSGASSAVVSINVGYWRKANAIHDWFVRTHQGGVDDCRMAYVTHEDLNDLVNLCKQVLQDPSRATELLPTKSGFFFGDTTYNEGYMEDLEYTVEMLGKILENPKFKNWGFEYSSSW